MSAQPNRYHQFRSLSLYQKLHFLHQHAVCLNVGYTTDVIEADLFSCDGFYIEIIVNRFSHAVLEVKAFRTTNRLKLYLSKIDISDVTLLLSLGQ